MPRVIITDKLRSYGAALRKLRWQWTTSAQGAGNMRVEGIHIGRRENGRRYPGGGRLPNPVVHFR